MIKVPNPLPLEGTKNTRELGGYPTLDGKRTKEHRFLRSDGVHQLTKKDIETLYDYDLRMVIDLRSKYEAEKLPDVFPKEIEAKHFPLLDHVQSGGLKEGEFPKTMEEMYIDLLDHSQETIKEILKAMALKENGCILFHCTAGKDRTGITAMLLLKLANVSDEIIIEDYSATYENMKDLFQKQASELKENQITVPEYIFQSQEKSMEKTLLHMHKTYGNVESYMEKIGLNIQEITLLKQHLLD